MKLEVVDGHHKFELEATSENDARKIDEGRFRRRASELEHGATAGNDNKSIGEAWFDQRASQT